MKKMGVLGGCYHPRSVAKRKHKGEVLDSEWCYFSHLRPINKGKVGQPDHGKIPIPPCGFWFEFGQNGVQWLRE